MKALILLAAATLIVTGCSNPNQVPSHSAEDEKALTELKNMTPQQQIERIQKGPMPESAKEAQIKKIKDKAGIQ